MKSRGFLAHEPGSPPALELIALSKTFGGQKALDNAALSVKQGEVHGLLGTNGSGKSTLIKILAGFLNPPCGRSRLVPGGENSLPFAPGRPPKTGVLFLS